MQRTKHIVFSTLLSITLAHSAWAQEESGGASLSTSGGDIDSTTTAPGEDPFEIGVFGGVLLLSGRESIEAIRASAQGPEMDTLGYEVGLRLGLYPIQYLGIEAEGAVAFSGDEADASARIGAARGNLVGQIPLGFVTPFALVGGGVLGAQCPPERCSSATTGRSTDGSFHFGLGVKLGLTDFMHARLDLRDNIAGGDHVPEGLLGLAFTFGGSDPEPYTPQSAPDSDGDGLPDDRDACPQEPADTPDGCPIRDTDGDGFLDDNDKCPDVPGIEPDGCPDPDRDKDGILNEDDTCPDVAGIAPDGCPDPDRDKDGIINDRDKCPDEPETANNFEDTDGCPDEIPDQVKSKFTGVIQGIEFDLNKATIRAKSFPVLDDAATILQEYSSLRVRVSGHTDNTGKPERNMALSQERAEAVVTYMTGRGIDAGRLVAVGHGPDKPIADNKTAAGRQKNRRIEFELIQ